jgi:hypothetical protein
MRVGMNPMVDQQLTVNKFTHRIVVPVYIPNAEGYFKNGFEVLKLSIGSLLQTVHEKTAITIIDNASSNEVSTYLLQLLEEQKIDQLIKNAVNKGKVDPIVSVMRGAIEPLLTLADADVLYKQGWQQEVEKIFNAIPGVGMVSPLPQPSLFRYYSKWSWYFGFVKKCFIMRPNEDLDAVKRFKESTVGFTSFEAIETNPLGINYNGAKAIIGAGHFCATYNKLVAEYIPHHSSGEDFYGAESLFLDKPVEDAGFLRLATSKGWVYHIGNTIEDWMNDIVQYNISHPQQAPSIIAKHVLNLKGFAYGPKFINNIVGKVISSSRFKNMVFKMARK